MPLLVKDRGLLKAFRKGEPWALEEVFAFYAPRLRRYLQSGFTFESQGRVCRFGGSATGADLDWVVQETFARAFEKRTRKAFDGQRPFARYLQTVARNLLLREINRNRRFTALEEGSPVEHDECTSPGIVRQFHADPEQLAEQHELQIILNRFLTELDREEADFVHHRFIEQKTQEATAELMQTTRARIKVLEASLRARFLDLFRTHGYFVECAPKPRWTRKDKLAVG
ncbi:MAG: sigma-70 family RNA polymerase sigma factor [Deltaproteobacteria bacterium]|nr:sigma-70 family RNA polymerase sigma factor [Deltaproteobacteria bacterium]